MITAKVYGNKESLRVYILPNPINKRMGFPETVDTAANVARTYDSKLYIEEVGYQTAIIQHLTNVMNVSAEGAKPSGQDKRSRLALITHLIQQGKILFPREGIGELILQLTGFGIEKHDDLADAFSLLLLKIMELDSEPTPGIRIISCEGFYNSRSSGLSDDIWDEPLTLNRKW